jgi:hypothetical protein
MHLMLNFRNLSCPPGNLQVVEVLQIEPEFSISVEIPGEAQGSLRSDTPTLVHNFSNSRRRYVQFERKLDYPKLNATGHWRLSAVFC